MNHLELIPVYTETLFEAVADEGNYSAEMSAEAQKIMVMVLKSEWNDTNEIFLKKILGAAKLNDKDYLIKVVGDTENIFPAISALRPEVLFLFGPKLESEFFRSQKSNYKPFIMNQVKIVLSDTLTVLSSDKDKRLLLWNQCIKPLFNIN
jgi:hypothetical protein